MLHRTVLAVAIVLCLHASAMASDVQFRVTASAAMPGLAAAGPLSGRLLISVIRPGAKVAPDEDPNNGPFWGDPQPLFAVDAAGLSPDHPALVGAGCDHSMEAIDRLAPGEYRAAARLIRARQSSNWRNDAGNLTSGTVRFTVAPDRRTVVDIALASQTAGRAWPTGARTHGAEFFEVRSALLSKFLGREVMLRAGVVKPTDFDPKRQYAAVYEVPGFGGDHFDAIGVAEGRSRRAKGDRADTQSSLDASTFWIVLDPESPNGHTLFADSANNGPCGRALVEELIPALEKKYPLVAKPEARLLRGHSSGGWSTLWLALNYPHTFGATWSTSPDPVDFRSLETIDIYSQHNAYWVGGNRIDADTDRWSLLDKIPGALKRSNTPDAADLIASFRREGQAGMTVKEEAQAEDILGPDNTSGQQWDSWMAAWGPRSARGHPAALFDPTSGEIDHAVAEQYRKYDITDLLRKHPERYGPIFRQNVRIVVGGADSFFLNEAVALLQHDVDALPPLPPLPPSPSPSLPQANHAAAKGYIKIVPGLDHGTIFNSAEVREFPAEMLAYLKENRLAVEPVPAKSPANPAPASREPPR